MARPLIDIRKLPPPEVIEKLDFEAVKKDLIAQYKALILEDYRKIYGEEFEILESDPAAKILETCAYREILLRARINDAAKRTLPAFATGSDLTHVLLRYGIERKSDESDEKLLSLLFTKDDFEAAAGSKASYIAHALNLELPKTKERFVEDANAVKGEKDGFVTVYLFFSERFKSERVTPDDVVIDDLLKIAEKTMRYYSPLTDYVDVKSCIKTKISLAFRVKILDGADEKLVISQSQKSLNDLFKLKIGQSVPKSLIYAAIHKNNDVQEVTKVVVKKAGEDSEREDLIVGPGEIGILDSLKIEVES
jgi:phage-related baseplate assembly protein